MLTVKAHANGRNKCQQFPTMLGVVGQQCWVRLHGPICLTDFKLYATSANIVVVPCKRTQQVLANNVGSVCMGLKKGTVYFYTFLKTELIIAITDEIRKKTGYFHI